MSASFHAFNIQHSKASLASAIRENSRVFHQFREISSIRLCDSSIAVSIIIIMSPAPCNNNRRLTHIVPPINLPAQYERWIFWRNMLQQVPCSPSNRIRRKRVPRTTVLSKRLRWFETDIVRLRTGVIRKLVGGPLCSSKSAEGGKRFKRAGLKCYFVKISLMNLSWVDNPKLDTYIQRSLVFFPPIPGSTFQFFFLPSSQFKKEISLTK
ncbi:hypothetical protein ABKN59_004361 [Abortiporus biennis]